MFCDFVDGGLHRSECRDLRAVVLRRLAALHVNSVMTVLLLPEITIPSLTAWHLSCPFSIRLVGGPLHVPLRFSPTVPLNSALISFYTYHGVLAPPLVL